MKTTTVVLPFLCAVAAAAPTVWETQSPSNTASPAVRRQDVNDGGSSILGGVSSLKARQNSDTSSGIGSILSSLGLRTRQNAGDSDGNDDDALANGVDGSHLKTDSNGQNVDVANLSGVVSSLRLRLRRALGPVPVESVPVSKADSDGDDNESVANVLDGSAAGINGNAQNVSVAELKRRQLLSGLLGGGGSSGGGGSQTENEDDGNGSDDDSLLNLLDGDTMDVDKNIQNVTVLRRGGFEEPIKKKNKNKGDGDYDNNDALANVLDGSAAAVDQNVQNVSVLRRRGRRGLAASPSASAPATAAATVGPSFAPVAPAPPAADPAPTQQPRSRPVVDAGDGVNNTKDNDNDNDDAVVNAVDNSSADVSKNLQNVTVLKKREAPGVVEDNKLDHDGDDNGTVANVLDGSALAADKNVQNVDVAELR